jgi:hypothetical protein
MARLAKRTEALPRTPAVKTRARGRSACGGRIGQRSRGRLFIARRSAQDQDVAKNRWERLDSLRRARIHEQELIAIGARAVADIEDENDVGVAFPAGPQQLADLDVTVDLFTDQPGQRDGERSTIMDIAAWQGQLDGAAVADSAMYD